LIRNIGAAAVVAALLAAATAGAQAVIDGGDIRNNSLTGKDVKNKSLTKRDFRGSLRGPRGFPGPQGAQGPQGPQGAQGPPGPINASGLNSVTGPLTTYAPGTVGSSIAFCPAGQRVVSGGGSVITGVADGIAVSRHNSDRTSWFVIAGNNSGINGEIQAVALCAGANQAVVANARDRAKTRREVTRLVAKLEARVAQAAE
jgi:hypothetical protein